MKAPREILAVAVLTLIIVSVSIWHFTTASEQPAPADDDSLSTAALLVNRPAEKDGVEKRISKEGMAPVFKKNGKAEYFVIDIYPVKNTPKEDISLEVVFRDPAGQPLVKPASEATFKTRARHYVEELRKKNNKLPVPYGYQILATKADFGTKNNLVLDLNPQTLTLQYLYDSCRYPPGCYSPTNNSAGKQNGTTYLLASPIFDKSVANDSCRYPPGCPRALMFTAAMESVLSEKNKSAAKTKNK